MAEWFGHEARRVYAMLGESDEDRDQHRLAEWIDRKGGSVTIREVQQGHRRFTTADDTEDALHELVEAGYGNWEDVPTTPKGGRPSRAFNLSTVSTSTKPPEVREIRGCVDVDGVDGRETNPQPTESGSDEGVVQWRG